MKIVKTELCKQFGFHLFYKFALMLFACSFLFLHFYETMYCTANTLCEISFTNAISYLI